MKKFHLLCCTMALMATLAGTATAAPRAEITDVFSRHGMVSSAHELASKAGVEIMQKGGNAVDAAVATALALNVVEPNASGIGGGGFMTVRFAETGEVVVIDYRETAPKSSTKDMYASEEAKEKKISKLGGLSIAVPGQTLGLWTALTKYGTMTWAEVAAPAIRLAEEGFVLVPMQNDIIKDNMEKLTDYNDIANVAFLDVEGFPLQAGDIVKQPKLAEAFKLIGEKGPRKAFYDGPIGKAVVEAVNKAGGNMALADLKEYDVAIRKPVRGTYRGYEIFSCPPASSGGTHIVELLNIMENLPVGGWIANGPEYLHYLGESLKLVFADRQKYMGDTAFLNVPLAGLTSKAYAKTLFERIKPYEVMEKVEPGDPWPYDSEANKTAYIGDAVSEQVSTTHFSVVDQRGNIVSSTNTVNYFFGSGVMVPEYGFVLNNQMDDFSQNPESVNAPEPGKRPLSSMSPTIVLDPQGQPFMTVGAAGGWRIITTVGQLIMNVIDFGMTMDQAIEQPRAHAHANDGKASRLQIENFIDPETVIFLNMRGHDVETVSHIGTAQGILFKGGMMNGGADSRRLGVSVGF
ncbi:gamma-glutamyltransferase [Dethiosulfovibrio salsuginis]|uniref:Glutathione hydrolase proenzyme n=1 Tax=Dethiosulfovibrio salsuginis TaxID=561720 RepID=A0A1X7K7X3_9BACT|nr:gamma-glutamyltransferase [Dethiosulfovibrio salsuginis]SMG37181.1 gamma-glutamyltransferase 1 Threonine peptidase. MEROPS family T03 [Dethiosulfovibrio salsuginis]